MIGTQYLPYSFVPFNNYDTNLTNFRNIVQTQCNLPSHLDIYYIHTTNNITNNNMAVALELEISVIIIKNKKIKKKIKKTPCLGVIITECKTIT